MSTLLALLLLLLSTPAWGAAAFLNATTNEATGTANPTFAFTASGNYLIVCTGNISANNATAATFNGVSMSPKANEVSGGMNAFCFELINPTAGSHTVSITLFASSSDITSVAADFSGVDTTSPSGTAGTDSDFYGPSPNEATVTVPTNGMAASFFTVSGTGHTLTQGGAMTQQASIDGAGTQMRFYTTTSTGSVTSSVSISPDDNYNDQVAFPINPTAATAAVRRRIIQ